MFTMSLVFWSRRLQLSLAWFASGPSSLLVGGYRRAWCRFRVKNLGSHVQNVNPLYGFVRLVLMLRVISYFFVTLASDVLR
jgi:hypothetical protein